MTKLSWSHYIVLMTLKDNNEIGYYLDITQNLRLSKRELEERIKNKEYERLDEKSKLKLAQKEQLSLQELIKNPLVIKNKLNKVIISEKILKEIVLENIDEFLEELGNNFSYVRNEYKIKIEEEIRRKGIQIPH